MRGSAESGQVDEVLLSRFKTEVWSRVPHFERGEAINPTPLLEITSTLKESAGSIYGLDISNREFRVFGKFEGQILGGSVKVRPAVQILYDAIESGRLRRGQTVFEVTSGNFGIALGVLAGMGLNVVALVSSSLKKGVHERLEASRVKTIVLDFGIHPASDIVVNPNVLVAKVLASSVRSRRRERWASISLSSTLLCEKSKACSPDKTS